MPRREQPNRLGSRASRRGDCGRQRRCHSRAAEIRHRNGRLDTEFNCAGVDGMVRPLTELSRETSSWSCGSATGAVPRMRCMVPLMVQGRRGGAVSECHIAPGLVDQGLRAGDIERGEEVAGDRSARAHNDRLTWSSGGLGRLYPMSCGTRGAARQACSGRRAVYCRSLGGSPRR